MTDVVQASNLAQINDEIWGAVLGMVLEPAGPEDAQPEGEELVTGQVQITGEWSGAVFIELSASLARKATAAMFFTEPDEVSEEDLLDAVGELANMTGGNVKAQLEGPHALSLPSVTSGRRYRVSMPGTRVAGRVSQCCDGQLLTTTVIESGAAPKADGADAQVLASAADSP